MHFKAKIVDCSPGREADSQTFQEQMVLTGFFEK
jgi:hypothetical protein